MTSRIVKRSATLAAGVAVIAAGLLVTPGTGGAAVGGGPDLSTSTTADLPADVKKAIAAVEESTGTKPTTTTTTTSTTSTTTTTTVPPTTTTTVASPDGDGDAGDDERVSTKRARKAKRLASSSLFDLFELPDLDIPLIDVDELRADYRRTDFPAYTPRFGKRSTMEVIELLEAANASPQVRAQVLAPFPVNGPASYSDDWGAPRFTPDFHLHEGIDVFAEGGTPVIAAADGTITRATMGTAVGGNVVYLTTADGTYFYYAHLDQIAPTIHPGMEVTAGTVLGTVGDSGNAAGGLPHLHFEIHPGGGDPVPPAPYLDSWLAAALDEARGVEGADAVPPVNVTIPPSAPSLNAGASVFPAQPASFGEESGSGWLVFVVPGALLLWWRRRRAGAIMATVSTRSQTDIWRDLGPSGP